MASNPNQQIQSGIARLAAGGGDLSAQQELYGDTGATLSQQKKAKKQNPFASLFNTTLSVLSRGSQLAPRYLNSLREQGDVSAQTTDPGSFARILDYVQAQPKAIAAAAQGATDFKGKNDIGLTKAITGEEAKSGSDKFADLVGSIVLDPTTYFGVGLLDDAGKAGKAAVAAKYGDNAAEQLGKKGIKGLTPAQQAAVTQTLADAAKNPALLGDTGLGKLTRAATLRGARTGEEKFLENATKALMQPTGVKFAGRTVLSSDKIGKALKTTGVASAANKVGDTSVLRGARKLVTPRFDITQNLGKLAEEGANNARVRGGAVTARLNAADLSHVEAALKPTNLAEKVLGGGQVSKEATLRISDALDSGELPQLIEEFTRTGQATAARYAKSLDDVRNIATDRLLKSGLAKADQLKDTSRYAARIPSQAGRKFLQDETKARKLLGYSPAKLTGQGVLQNAAPQFRKLPDVPISELNKLVEEKTGIKEFFEVDPAKRILGRSMQINENVGVVERLKELANVTVDGQPLAIITNAAEESKSAIKDLTKNYQQTVKALDSEINREIAEFAKVTGQARGITQGLREIDTAIVRGQRAVNAADTALRRVHNAQIAIGVASRAARNSGRFDIGSIAPMTAALQDAQGLLAELRSIPSIPASEIREAEEALARTKDALKIARRSEAARAGAKGLQQAVGRTNALVTESRKLESVLNKALKARQREVSALTKSADRLTGTLPDASKQRLNALRQERSALFQSFLEQKRGLREAGKVSVPAGYARISAGPLGNMYAPAEIAADVEKVAKLADNDADVKLLAKSANAMSSAWRNLALNTFLLSTGTAVRNAVTDMQMMLVRGGFKDPAKYKPAVKAIKAMEDASKGGRDILSATKSDKLTKWEQAALRFAIKEGVVTSGLFSTDVAATGIATTKGQLAKQAINLTNRKNIATRTLGNVNEIISNTNRLALFFDVYSRTGNAGLAARTVREAMIDYTDLTKYEKGAKRYLIPFYTFASRNLTNAVWDVVHVPGRTVSQEKIRQALFNQDDPEGPAPDYAVAGDMGAFLNVGGTPILGNIQSPLQAAAQTAQPLADIASTLPGMPQTEGGAGAAAAGALQNIGGFEGTLAKNAAQEATGTNLFTGAPLREDESPWARLLSAIVPSEQKGVSTVKDLQSGDKAVQTARLLSLLGLTSTANTEDRQNSELYRRIRELGSTANQQNIPTLTDLRKQGKAAPAPKKKSTKKKKTTP